MSSFGNTDAQKDVPKWSKERVVRNTIIATANAQSAVNQLVLNTSNGISIGMYVSGNNINQSSVLPGFFRGNVTVTNVFNTTTINISSNLLGTVQVGDVFKFDTLVPYRVGPEANSYINNTILVTSSRKANSNAAAGITANGQGIHVGWNKITVGTGGRAGRVQVETLVALSNPVASNSNSGGIFFSGV